MPEGPPDVSIDTSAIDNPLKMMRDVSDAIFRMQNYLNQAAIAPQHFGQTESGQPTGQAVRTGLDSLTESISHGHQFGVDLAQALEDSGKQFAETEESNRRAANNADGGNRS